MLGTSVPSSPFFTFDYHPSLCFSTPSVSPYITFLNVKFSDGTLPKVIGRGWACSFAPKNWDLHCSTQTDQISLVDDEAWEKCKRALSPFNFSAEEQNKMLGKAFGQVHSPYWGAERNKQVPNLEVIEQILDYLRSLTLSDEDISKLLKKFPEVLGCNLEDELKINVKILEKEWGIKGKSLRSLLLRNPKVLGYNVDCKGNCMAQCTRCWVRF